MVLLSFGHLAIAREASCTQGDLPVVLYYPLGQSTLTSDAQKVLAQAIERSNPCMIDKIIIEGHADRSGNALHNMVLSLNRAARVEYAFRQSELHRSYFIRSGKGEAALAVQTDDGVVEPLNRRVEILIQFK